MNLEHIDKVKVTTRNSLILKSCKIIDFHWDYYIPSIEKLDCHIPHVYIFGKNHCEGKWNDMFLSWHNKYDWKGTCIYPEKCQVLSEQVYSQ